MKRLGITWSLLLVIACSARGAVTTTLTSSDAVKLAKQFESAMAAQAVSEASAIIDGEAIVARAEQGVAASPGYAAGFSRDASKGLVTSMVNSIVQSLKQGSTYKLLRVRQTEGKTVAVFRLLNPADDSANYFEWEVGPEPKGELRFVDQYDLCKGDWASHGLRKFYLEGEASEDKANNVPLQGREKEVVESFQMMLQLTRDSTAGKYKEALADYKSLPASVQEDKSCMVMYVAAAGHAMEGGEAAGEYNTALAAFEKRFRNDPAVELLGMDHWAMEKDWERLHTAIGRIRAFVGGDAHMDYLDASVYLASGKPEDVAKALAVLKNGVVEEPDLGEVHWSLVTAYLAQKDWSKTAEELTTIETKLGVPIADLTKVPAYAEFVKTAEYGKWMAQRSASAGTGSTQRH